MFDQFHLNGKRCSGRAVRVQQLDDQAVADNLTAAAKTLGKDAIYAELKKLEWKMGIRQFVVAISDPCTDPFAADVKWRKVNASDFEDGLKTFFTAKDVMVLEALYREYHEVSTEELEIITGKGKAVSEA